MFPVNELKPEVQQYVIIVSHLLKLNNLFNGFQYR